jgi:transcriptional regulator NrdR family protein
MIKGRNVLKRTRDCKDCGYKWTTYEVDLMEFDLLEEMSELLETQKQLGKLISKVEKHIGSMENTMVYNTRGIK